MDTEIEQLDTKMEKEIIIIREKYNNLKQKIIKKYNNISVKNRSN